MMEKSPIEYLYNWLDSLCRELDFLSDPHIEKKMGCTLDCCIGNSLPNYFESILLPDSDKRYEEIIGITGLELLKQFEKIEKLGIYYDSGIHFAQQDRWKEFAALARKLSTHIKKSIKNHKLSIDSKDQFRNREYGVEHTDELIENYIKPLTTARLDGHQLQDFMARSQCIIESPDSYSGITNTLFNQLKRLYYLSFLALQDYKDGDRYDKVCFFKETNDPKQIEDIQRSAQNVLDIYKTHSMD